MYSLSERRWGFRLAVPVFHGHNTLHLSCSSFVCDRRTDDKRHCDRTCSNMHQRLTTRRRRSRDITKMSFGRDAEVNGGYIAVKDVGSGPIIYSNGSVLVVPRLNSMGAPSGKWLSTQFLYCKCVIVANNGKPVQQKSVKDGLKLIW
jgi:hypothetical protein